MGNYLIEKPTSQIDGKNASVLLTNSLGYFFAIVDKYPNVQSGKWWCIGMRICTGTGKYKVIVVSDIKNYAVVGDGYTDSYGDQDISLYGYTESFDYNGQTLYVGVPESTIGVAYTDAKVPIYDGEVFSDMKIAAKKLVDLYAESGGELPWEQSYSKVEYSRINWVDEEVSHETPIDADNLNKMDKAIEELCKNLDIAHTEIGNKAASSEIPTKVSQLNNDSNYQTETQVKSTVSSEVAKIVADAPEDYDTLKEISDWISGHENDASAMNSAIKANTKAIDTKVNKNGFGDLAGGKNLFDEEYTDIKSGSLTYKSLHVGDGAFTMSTTAPLNSKSGAILFFLPGKVTSGASTSTNGVYATKSRTVTAVDGYVTIGYRIDELNPDDYKTQLEAGISVTDYEIYYPSNKMLSEENAKQSTEMMDIKMLGWSVPRECPIQNEVNGNQFVQKVGRVDLGTLNWVYDATSGHERFRTANVVLSFIKPSQTNGIPANIYTNGYTTNSANGTYLHADDKGISVDTDSVIWVYDSTYTDATAFKSAMEGQYLYYELAAPIITTIDGNEIGETVDDLEEKLDKFTQKFVTKRVQLVKDPVSDYYRTISPISDEPYISVPRFIVQGGYSTFGPDPDGEEVVGGENYTCAEKAAVKFDILTPEINGSITQGGITVTYNANRKSYTIKGAAEDDIEIPLYSVSTPRDNTLMFRTTNLSRMSSTQYYIKISDAGGSNEVTIGEDDSKKETASLKTHVGKVTVYLVVKAGTNRFSQIKVRAGYSLAHEIADYSPNKYSDTVDNVIDAILDLDSRLKVLENK